MVLIYANRIERLGQTATPFTIDDVVELYKERVLAELASRGLDGYGAPLIVEGE